MKKLTKSLTGIRKRPTSEKSRGCGGKRQLKSEGPGQKLRKSQTLKRAATAKRFERNRWGPQEWNQSKKNLMQKRQKEKWKGV